MMFTPSNIAGHPTHERDGAGLDARVRATILAAPVAITMICLGLCMPTEGRRFYDWLTSENKPVEMLTFVLALVAAVMGVNFAIELWRRRPRERFAGIFYIVFALGMFVIGMEEIAWGQSLLGFQTPQAWAEMNAQHETTLHNLSGFQGHNDILRFAFGAGGLVGIALAPLLPRFRALWPHRVLVLWFLIIAACSAVQLYVDAMPNGPLVRPLEKLGRLAEVIELLISIAAVLYLWINRRQLARA
ncbi:MAG: hypothetical protein QOE14_1078 [Humisphaera sp.]|nr:hypothetical protein [Humisphaera sp.]